MFDLEAREQRHIVFVEPDAPHIARHDVAHKLAGLFVDFLGVDEDFADVRLEVIANRANHQAAFLENQEGGGLRTGGGFDGGPQLQQVV